MKKTIEVDMTITFKQSVMITIKEGENLYHALWRVAEINNDIRNESLTIDKIEDEKGNILTEDNIFSK